LNVRQELEKAVKIGRLDPILGIFRETEQSLLFMPKVLHRVKAVKDSQLTERRTFWICFLEETIKQLTVVIQAPASFLTRIF